MHTKGQVYAAKSARVGCLVWALLLKVTAKLRSAFKFFQLERECPGTLRIYFLLG